MHNLLRYYRRNRKRILVVILGIVFVILLVQMLNFINKKENLKKSQSKIATNTNKSNDSVANKKLNESVIIGKETDEKKTTENTTIIKEFFSYCNDKKVNEAYSLLSEQCKELIYPTIDDFVNNYYSYVFNEQKIYDLQSWVKYEDCYTYKVTIMSDIMASGEKNDNTKSDYFTIIKADNGERKINLGGYVSRVKIDKQIKVNNVIILVNYKDVYMNYESYNITIKNNTDKTILLNRKENIKTIYLEDENEIKYNAYLHEIPDNLFIINSRSDDYF